MAVPRDAELVRHTIIILIFFLCTNSVTADYLSASSIPDLYDVLCCVRSGVFLFRERLCSVVSLPCGDARTVVTHYSVIFTLILPCRE